MRAAETAIALKSMVFRLDYVKNAVSILSRMPLGRDYLRVSMPGIFTTWDKDEECRERQSCPVKHRL
jgi:hypothetical protein